MICYISSCAISLILRLHSHECALLVSGSHVWLCVRRQGYGATAGNSRTLVDVTGKTAEKDKKEADQWVARSEKTSELWRPGAGFRPTSFSIPNGPKVCCFFGQL
jgi:hypothetical protein